MHERETILELKVLTRGSKRIQKSPDSYIVQNFLYNPFYPHRQAEFFDLDEAREYFEGLEPQIK